MYQVICAALSIVAKVNCLNFLEKQLHTIHADLSLIEVCHFDDVFISYGKSANKMCSVQRYDLRDCSPLSYLDTMYVGLHYRG